jgi:hypothetical protein
MRRLLEHRWIVILLSLAGLMGLGLLAAELREVEFQPGGPFPLLFSSASNGSVSASDGLNLSLVQWLSVIALWVVVLTIILVLLNPKTRKRALIALFRFAISLWALWLVLERFGLQMGRKPTTPTGQPTGNLSATPPALPPEFAPPQVHSWVGLVVSFIVALGIVALAWLILRRSRPRKFAPLEELAGIARQALDGLQDGRDWDDAIVAAYIRMNAVVTAERGLTRQPGTTPSEFAIYMEIAGLPGEAARTLTRLFEQVRYGAHSSTRRERDLAAAALAAILQACGAAASSSPSAPEPAQTEEGSRS